MHPPTPPSPSPSPQNTLRHRPVRYTPGSPCIPDSILIPLATSPVTPCTSADPAPALQSRSPRAQPLPVTTWLQRACRQTKPHPVRTSHLPTVRTQSQRASLLVVEFSAPLPVSH